MKTLNVVLSEKCNLNCTYCNQDKWSKKEIDPYLFLEEYKRIREEFPDELIRIDFFGGEPLMFMDLIKIIIAETEHDSNIKYVMPTNGLLLTEDNLPYILEKKIEVSISFDGLWQDRNRLQLNGKGTFERFLEKREIFRQIPDLKMHTMIYKGCYNLLENHLYIKNNYGINPELTLVRDMGVWDQKSVDRLKDGIKELFDWYIANPTEEMPFFILFYLRHFLNYTNKRYTRDFCGAGTNIFMFSENKTVPCNRFKDEPKMIEDIPKYIKMSVCQTCEVKNYCEKGCLFEQIKNKGPIAELCDIYKYAYNQVRHMTKSLYNNDYFKNTVMMELEKG
jgi:radical SAM protein with 4Fe4S-binding SPASM domain